MDDIKTSQTQWSGVDDQDKSKPAATQYGTDQASPLPVTEPQKGESSRIEAMQTSQQKAGEHHTAEG